jgi:hypothetical protein
MGSYISYIARCMIQPLPSGITSGLPLINSEFCPLTNPLWQAVEPSFGTVITTAFARSLFGNIQPRSGFTGFPPGRSYAGPDTLMRNTIHLTRSIKLSLSLCLGNLIETRGVGMSMFMTMMGSSSEVVPTPLIYTYIYPYVSLGLD